MADADQSNLTVLTVDLLSAYLANNSVQHGDLGELVKSTHAALKTIDAPEPEAPAEPEYKPAVSVRKSLASQTHIISMIDGKPYQTLKRHLSKHGLTDKEYRERYSLPRDYPMVAPAYSQSRRDIAQRLGLGQKGKVAKKQAPAFATVVGETKPEPAAAKTPVTKASAAPVKTETATAPAADATPKPKAAPKSKAAKPAAKSQAAPVAKASEPVKAASKARAARKPAQPAAVAPADAAPTTAKAAPKKRAAKPAAEPTPAS